jgi:hypothetical protein
MIRLSWLPWRRIVSRLAKSRGLVDPVTVLARLESFGQPTEIREPLELLRAGLVFHRRGLMNAAAIQHNLDWIWPYWVERQYDPEDVAFIPRAFSITHINLTHRNWTAVGLPGNDCLPIVDPRGLVTPFWDGWSIDAWIAERAGRRLFPSRVDTAEQHLDLENFAVVTQSAHEGLRLTSRVHVVREDGLDACRIELTAEGPDDAALVVSVRPFNPEGISFIHEARAQQGDRGLLIDGRTLNFDTSPSRFVFSDYRGGDVSTKLFGSGNHEHVICHVGMASAAALFRLRASAPTKIEVSVPLRESKDTEPAGVAAAWQAALSSSVQVRLPDRRLQALYETAIRTLILHSPGEVLAGPFTYKRFWFRDATFVMNALLCAGLGDRVERGLEGFWPRQTSGGLFLSQEGEWDSNGQVLWLLRRYCDLTGRAPAPDWKHAILRAAHWLENKRLRKLQDSPHAGLLPAGFSAEHLGPSDYYYWDDFWGVAGVGAAAALMHDFGDAHAAAQLETEASRFLADIEKSLGRVAAALGRPGMPASPYRRLDSGSIGSLVAGYPLRLFSADDPRLLDTARFLLSHCLVGGGFFLDIIHSGINAYLTLHIAQVLLRAGDPRALDLLAAVADLASPTGQWPEAIHPATRGGCMGDGQHAWAAAELSLMVRNLFLREEGDKLILGSGIRSSWLVQSEVLSISGAPTPFGDVTIEFRPLSDRIEVECLCQWRKRPSDIEVRLPGFEPRRLAPPYEMVSLARTGVR